MPNESTKNKTRNVYCLSRTRSAPCQGVIFNITGSTFVHRKIGLVRGKGERRKLGVCDEHDAVYPSNTLYMYVLKNQFLDYGERHLRFKVYAEIYPR